MRKDYILTEDERIARMQKIRLKRLQNIRFAPVHRKKYRKRARPITELQPSSPRLVPPSSWMDSQNLNSSGAESSSTDSSFSPRSLSESFNDELSSEEFIKIERLISSHKTLSVSHWTSLAECEQQNVILLSDSLIRNMVSIAKEIPGFSTIPAEDHLELLKSGWINVMILWSTMSLDQDMDVTVSEVFSDLLNKQTSFFSFRQNVLLFL